MQSRRVRVVKEWGACTSFVCSECMRIAVHMNDGRGRHRSTRAVAIHSSARPLLLNRQKSSLGRMIGGYQDPGRGATRGPECIGKSAQSDVLLGSGDQIKGHRCQEAGSTFLCILSLSLLINSLPHATFSHTLCSSTCYAMGKERTHTNQDEWFMGVRRVHPAEHSLASHHLEANRTDTSNKPCTPSHRQKE